MKLTLPVWLALFLGNVWARSGVRYVVGDFSGESLSLSAIDQNNEFELTITGLWGTVFKPPAESIFKLVAVDGTPLLEDHLIKNVVENRQGMTTVVTLAEDNENLLRNKVINGVESSMAFDKPPARLYVRYSTIDTSSARYRSSTDCSTFEDDPKAFDHSVGKEFDPYHLDGDQVSNIIHSCNDSESIWEAEYSCGETVTQRAVVPSPNASSASSSVVFKCSASNAYATVSYVGGTSLTEDMLWHAHEFIVGEMDADGMHADFKDDRELQWARFMEVRKQLLAKMGADGQLLESAVEKTITPASVGYDIDG